jgi:hypothetical protein
MQQRVALQRIFPRFIHTYTYTHMRSYTLCYTMFIYIAMYCVTPKIIVDALPGLWWIEYLCSLLKLHQPTGSATIACLVGEPQRLKRGRTPTAPITNPPMCGRPFFGVVLSPAKYRRRNTSTSNNNKRIGIASGLSLFFAMYCVTSQCIVWYCNVL